MYIDTRLLRRTTLYSFYPPNVFDMPHIDPERFGVRTVSSKIAPVVWFALVQFKGFFRRLCGQIAYQRSHATELVDLVGMTSRPWVDNTVEGYPMLNIGTPEIFRVEKLTAMWLTPMAERTGSANGSFFWEDLRFVETLEFGGVMVIRSTRQRQVVALYKLFTDGFGMSDDEYVWHTEPELREDPLMQDRQSVTATAGLLMDECNCEDDWLDDKPPCPVHDAGKILS